jgi:hypothetical protein
MTKLEQIKIIANNVLYFDDGSDYATALYEILDVLGYTEKQMHNLAYIDEDESKREITNECPVCKVGTQRENLGSMSTLMGWTTMVDEFGETINNDPNTITTAYRCMDCKTAFQTKSKYGKIFSKEIIND